MKNDRLRKAGIRHFDVLIHDQPKEWLIKNFSQGADEYPVNVARLMRNIIWQTRERIANGQNPPLKKLIRTFWYIHRDLEQSLNELQSLKKPAPSLTGKQEGKQGKNQEGGGYLRTKCLRTKGSPKT